MTPESAISALDRSLAVNGISVTLRRLAGSPPNQFNLDVQVQVFLRSFRPYELTGGIVGTDSKIILSPTQIADAQWPGGSNPTLSVDPSIPVIGDKLIVAGRLRDVKLVNPIYLNSVLVRIELAIKG